MPGIDWEARRETHTIKAIQAAKRIDWPDILLVIYYPCMSAYSQPPLHYIINAAATIPITRKRAESFTGLRVLFLPDEKMEVSFV